jgi:hypothetical protein
MTRRTRGNMRYYELQTTNCRNGPSFFFRCRGCRRAACDPRGDVSEQTPHSEGLLHDGDGLCFVMYSLSDVYVFELYFIFMIDPRIGRTIITITSKFYAIEGIP